MRKGLVKYNNIEAGEIIETNDGEFHFFYYDHYIKNYPNLFIAFNFPVIEKVYKSKTLFPFFEGLIPEGWLLNIAQKNWKLK